jgi:hypothetical protein
MAGEGRVSREELLARMGIASDDFEDYVNKIALLVESLNKDEKRFYYRNNGRTVEQIAKSLGPDVTTEDIETLFRCVPRFEVFLALACCGHNPAPPPPH